MSLLALQLLGGLQILDPRFAALKLKTMGLVALQQKIMVTAAASTGH